MDTFLQKTLVHHLQIPLSVEAKVKKEASHKESLSRPNTVGFPRVKTKRKRCIQEQRLWLRKCEFLQMLRRLAASFVGKRKMKYGFSARDA
jgi:hypothetical protein